MWDKAPMTQQVARKLQDMIRSGEWKAGEKLPSQRILSERLNISRPTLREALLTLETLGMVHTLPARGTFIANPREAEKPSAQWRYQDAYSQQEVMQLRLVVEGEICRLVATSATPDLIRDLRDAADIFAQAWAQGDLVAHVQADLEFHRLIAAACPNRMLKNVYETYQTMLTETQRQPIPQTHSPRMQASIAEHGMILNAISDGDGVKAEAAMRTHIRNTAAAAHISL